MRKERISIKDVSINLTNEKKFLLYGQFLDDFYHAEDNEKKYNLIKDEPKYILDDEIFMCILAGTAEKLAHDYGLETPDWVRKKEYIYDGIYYAFNTKMADYQEYLRQTTADEYKKRNLMLGEGVLTRC